MRGPGLPKNLKDHSLSFVILAAAIALYIVTGNFEYTAKPGRLGPNFWPRLLLALIMVMSLLEIAVALGRGGRGSARAEAGPAGEEQPAVDESKKRYPVLLVLGIGLTLGYVLLVSLLGFALTTFLFLVCFMYLGRYRRHAVIWVSSLVGTLLLMLIFVKLVYVSLPPGIPPFDSVTYLIYTLLGIS